VQDHCAKIWDVASGRLVRELKGHFGPLWSVTFLGADSRRLAAEGERDAEGNGEIRIWDVSSGELLTVFPGGGSWTSLSASPDGRRLAAVWGTSEAIVWDVATGRELLHLKGADQDLWGVAFSPDGHLIAAGGGLHGRRRNGDVVLWDSSSGRLVRKLQGHVEMLQSVVFSADGQRLLSAGADQTIKIWDVHTGLEILTLRGHRNFVVGLAFANDGRLFSGAEDRSVLVWDGRPWKQGERGQEFLTLTGHSETVTSLAYSPDGRILASADCDGFVKLWQPWTGRDPQTWRAGPKEIYGIAFDPSGRRLAAVGSHGLIRTWRVPEGTVAQDLSVEDGTLMCIAYSPDGRYLAVSGWVSESEVMIWDSSGARVKVRLVGHNLAPNTLTFRPRASHHLVSAGEDGALWVWDLDNARASFRLGTTQEGRIKGVAFSGDGTLLASGGWDRTVHLWDSSNADPARWTPLPAVPDPAASIECLAISPDGRHVAWGGTDSTIKVWDRTSGDVHTLRGHLAWVRSVAFSPDGQHIVSGSQDGTIKIWPLPSAP
jgi:WD40 repeat protein